MAGKSTAERVAAIVDAFRNTAEHAKGRLRLVFDERPSEYRHPKTGEVCGAHAMVRLFDGADEIPIDPHRIVINPPVDVDDPGAGKGGGPPGGMPSKEDPHAAFLGSLWDSIDSAPNPRGWRTRGTVTTVYGVAGEGRIKSTSATYSTARGAGGTKTLFPSSGNDPAIGQYYYSGEYGGNEAFLGFDASSIDDTDIISDVTLEMYYMYSSGTPDSVEVRSYDWGSELATGDWVAGDSLTSSTLVASYTGSYSTGYSYKTFTSESAFMSVSNIKTGTVRLVAHSVKFRTASTPSGYEISTWGRSSGAHPARLVITHQPSGANVEAGTLSGAASLSAPTIRTGSTLSPPAATTATLIPSATAGAGVRTTPGILVATVDVPSTSERIGSTVLAQPVATVAAVPVSTERGGAPVLAVTITGSVSVPSPFVVSGIGFGGTSTVSGSLPRVVRTPGARRFSFRYELLDSSNTKVDDLLGVVSCKVEQNWLADIKRKATFRIRDGAGSINWLSDRIKPWVRLHLPPYGSDDWVEWPQGVFLLSSPTRSSDATGVVYRDVQGYDQGQVYMDDKVSDRYTVAAGTRYTDAVSTLLDTGWKIVAASASTLPTDKEWEPGTSKLRIINDLLDAINYESLSFDENGYAIVRPYTSPSQRAEEYEYADNAVSVMLPEVEQGLDLFSVPNRWTLVVSDPDRVALVSTYTNTDPASPTSTVNRQRTIVDFRQEQDAADQAALDAKVARLAFEASQVYESVGLETGLMPVHSGNDVFRVNYSPLAVNAKYAETSWSMELKAGAQMSHEARRVVNV